jgi:diguanylate cyclase (GGDEF)-like protein
MIFDPRTLLFSLILTNLLMVVNLFVAASAEGREKRDGMEKWSAAILLGTLTWLLGAARGHVPDVVSIVGANGLMAGGYALILAAICDFQRRTLSRWFYLAPIAMSMGVAAIFQDDLSGRFLWGGPIYALQMALIARTLLTDAETRSGKAWRLLFGGAAMIVLVIGLRIYIALTDPGALDRLQIGEAIHWVQLVTYVGLMSTAIMGPIGFILMIKERTDREVMHLAMTDSLTQIPNRRALIDQAERALAHRGGHSVAVLMVDVDYFKRINDNYGHPVGDEVLRKVAALLAKRLRRNDILGRYGGEEFCVVAPETDIEGAQILAEALRQLIASTVIATECGELTVTISVGYSCCMSNGEKELSEMLTEADIALYAAKQAGRNRVSLFQPTAACGDEDDSNTMVESSEAPCYLQ